MYPDLNKRSSFFSRRMRSLTLVRIRWIGLIAQPITILFVAIYMGFPLPMTSCFILVGLSASVNLYLAFHYSYNDRLTPWATTLVLAFDILQLAALLFLTGGLQNPFSILLIAPAVISASSLPLPHIIILNLLVISTTTLLAFIACPLPWYSGQIIVMPRLLIDAMWAGIISSLLFTTAYIYRVAEEARRLADALTATDLILEREKHLSALDGLAAAAAHELGTPLATIQLVVKEMQHALKNNPAYSEDIELLRSQTERCRDILKRLTSLDTDNNSYMAHYTLTSLLEEVIAPHRDFDIDIITVAEKCEGNEPELMRNSGVLYGLGNLLENAIDFARKQIQIHYRWNDKIIEISIIDDGDGYDPQVLDRIGEPYVSHRNAESRGGGLGLGLFIAKTLLERSGASVRFQNHREKHLGAEVKLVWERKNIIEYQDKI